MMIFHQEPPVIQIIIVALPIIFSWAIILPLYKLYLWTHARFWKKKQVVDVEQGVLVPYVNDARTGAVVLWGKQKMSRMEMAWLLLQRRKESLRQMDEMHRDIHAWNAEARWHMARRYQNILRPTLGPPARLESTERRRPAIESTSLAPRGRDRSHISGSGYQHDGMGVKPTALAQHTPFTQRQSDAMLYGNILAAKTHRRLSSSLSSIASDSPPGGLLPGKLRRFNQTTRRFPLLSDGSSTELSDAQPAPPPRVKNAREKHRTVTEIERKVSVYTPPDPIPEEPPAIPPRSASRTTLPSRSPTASAESVPTSSNSTPVFSAEASSNDSAYDTAPEETTGPAKSTKIPRSTAKPPASPPPGLDRRLVFQPNSKIPAPDRASNRSPLTSPKPPTTAPASSKTAKPSRLPVPASANENAPAIPQRRPGKQLRRPMSGRQRLLKPSTWCAPGEVLSDIMSEYESSSSWQRVSKQGREQNFI